MVRTETNNRLPSSWQWVSLREISEVISKGTTPTTLGHAFTSTGIPFLRAEDVNGGAVEPSKVAFHISPETHSFLGRSQLQPGDFLITIAGTLGRIGYLPPDAPLLNCNQAVAFVRLKPEVIDIKFACFICQCEEVINSLLELKKVGTIGNLNLEQVGELKIPLPPLSEQRRILAIAQKADRLRRTRRYALQLSDTYLRSVFLEMFGDYLHSGEVCELDDVITVSPSNGLYKSEEFLGSGALFLDIKCLYRGFSVDFSEPRRVQITEKEQKKYEVFPGDILINRVSKKPQGVGKAVLVIDVKEPTVYESNMMRFRVNPSKVQPWFLIYYLASEVSRRELLSKANISNQASINQETLKSLKLPLPPLPLQEKFAQIVQKFDRLRTQQREADRQAEHLFQTLLHRAFRGELTSQNADDEPESVLLEEIRAQQAKAEAKAKTATQAMGDAADYLGTKAKQQDIEPIQLKFPGFE